MNNMRKKLFISLLTVLLWLSLIGTSYADSEEEASGLYNEAVQLLVAAKKTEPTSYQGALKFLKQALGNLEEITTRYSGSQVAFKLSLGELKVENYTIQQLEGVLPKLEGFAILEQEVRKDPKTSVVPILQETFSVLSALSEGELTSNPNGFATMKHDLVAIYASMGKIEEARQVRRKIRVSRFASGFDYTFDVLWTIEGAEVTLCVRDGQLEKALQASKSDATRIIVMRAALEMGEIEKALQIAQGIQDREQRSQALIGIADLYTRAGETQRAKQILEEALQTAQEIIPDENKQRYVLAKIYVELGQPEKALYAAQEILGYARVEMLKVIARTVIKAEYTQNAEQVLGKMLEIAQRMRGAEKCYILLAISEAYFALGKTQTAEQILLQALQMAQKDPLLLDAAASVYTKAEQYQKAKYLLNKVFQIIQEAEVGGRLGILEKMARRYVEEERAQEARKMFDGLLTQTTQEVFGNGLDYEELLSAHVITEIFAEIGEAQKAEQALELTLQAAPWPPNEHCRALIPIARKYIELKLGDPNRVAQILEQTLQAAQKGGKLFRLDIRLEVAALWIELAPRCEERIAVRFLHSIVGEIL